MLNISPIFNAMMRNKSSIILIIMQIALTLAIVSNAAFIIKDRIDDMNRDSGIPESEIIGLSMYFYDDNVDIAKQLLLDQQKIMEIPGVVEATGINQLPLSGSGDSWGFRNQLEGEGAKSAGAGVFTGNYNMTKLFGHEITQGRDFRPDDFIVRATGSEIPKVAIITQALADELFPDGDAIGKYMYSIDMPFQIIGIIDNMQGPWVHSSMVDRNVLMPVLSVNQFIRFAIRVEPGHADNILKDIQDILLKLENRRVINEASTIADMKASSYQRDRLMTNMLIVIIVVLVFITALGIAGMTIFNVNRRQKQIGTRRALGASRADIQRYFMTEGAIIALLGIVIGTILALVLNNYLMTYFSSESLSFDYIVYTLIGIIVVIEVAVFLPALKASKISPAIATRSV